ncbi:MAG TPA: hypothetical protein VLM79_35425, partial [Kofleriaceae bacterium]|nr:hypothetical protein [Kofleriaceae bacterium]
MIYAAASLGATRNCLVEDWQSRISTISRYAMWESRSRSSALINWEDHVARGKHFWRFMLRTFAILAIALSLPRLAAAQGAITVKNGDPNGNNYFSVNGTPRFLVFVSYFDGLDVPQGAFVDDLNYLRARGVDGIRILANWWVAPNDYTAGPLQYAQNTLFLPNGTLRSTTRDAMGWYLDRAREANMVVDLTLTAETVSSNQFGGGPDDLTFNEYRNAILDLVNFLR